MNKTTNVIKEKKATLDYLEQIFDMLDREEGYVKTKPVWYDTDEPRLNEDGSIKTREDGTTVYKQDYRTEDMPDEQLTEREHISLKAIQEIRNHLEKLV